MEKIIIENPHTFNYQKIGDYLQVKIMPDVVINRKIIDRFENKDSTIPFLVLNAENTGLTKKACNYTAIIEVSDIEFNYRNIDFNIIITKEVKFHINRKNKVTNVLNNGIYSFISTFKYDEIIKDSIALFNIKLNNSSNDDLKTDRKNACGKVISWIISDSIEQIDKILDQIDKRIPEEREFHERILEKINEIDNNLDKYSI
jgi:hypothetical protein